ncbi:MAG: hypothetical protein MR319_09455 [Mediterranea sp.]|nr:hypothetical protein [Mediterranea sp.]
MADILKFKIINTKMTRFCEKVGSKQVVLGRFFALCGRFVADLWQIIVVFSSKKHLYCRNNHGYHKCTAVNV